MSVEPGGGRPERWERVKAVFGDALQRRPGDRLAFLDQTCSGDPELRREVDSLLAAHQASDSFLEHPAAALGRPTEKGRQLTEGQTVGTYRVLRTLGRGGMATVYLAHDLRHRRSVALKVLHPELGHAVGPERFLREIDVAANLSHPHILPLFDSGEADGLLYYAMPHVEGESLRDRLRRETQLPVEEALQIAREVADALNYAHGQGVIHRDIKPENILLSGGHALVADFGIARVLGGTGGERLTETGMAVGTVAYMSPEQASGTQRIDGRSDVYSLGCVLYEMLAGEPPYTGPTAQAIIAKRLSDPVPSVRRLRPAVPSPVDRAVSRALAPVAADRFPTVAEFDGVLQSSSASPTLGGTNSHAPAISIPDMRRRRLVPLTAFTLAVGILIGIGVLLAGRGRVPRDDPPNDSSLKRLAVLPFENLGDSADAYFADGMTDAVRGKLTALPGLQVIARNSSSQYQPTAKSAKQIGRELGVDYILAGTVRWDRGAAGARVLVSPELITVATEAATWQQPFNAEMRDVFQVQADLAGQVAAALGLELGAAARKRLAESPTASLAAYDAYLRGNAIATRRGLHDRALARQAVAQYEQAIALDSNFVEAWADLASVYALQYSDGPRSLELADAARRAAERTRSLAPGRSEGHLALGGYYSYVLEDQPRAQAELAEGERIDPNNASLLNRLGYVEWRLGQVGVALQHMERSAKLDPRSATAAGVLGRARLWLRHYPEAVAATDRALSLAPTDLDKREFRAMVSLAQGDLAGARAVLRAAPREVGPTDLVAYVADYFDLAWVLDDEQQQLLLRLRPSAFDGDRSIWAGVLAQTYALRGDSIRSRAYADSARRALEGQLRDAPDEPDLHMRLAIALAYLDRDAEALREGERALGLGGVSKDAVDAPYYRHQLVRLHLLAGQPEKALDHLEPLLKIPYYLSPGWLKIDPTFDPLRGNSRFERLLEETS